MPTKFPRNWLFLTIVFRWNLSWIFPWNQPFFLQICLWKFHEIWPFFSDLSEALCYERFMCQVLDLVTFFSLSPPTFFLHEHQLCPILTNHILKEVNVCITLEAWKSGLNVQPSFWPDKSYFWLDIVRWLVIITSPDVGVPSWSYGSWALYWVPWVLQVHSTRLGPLQFLLEHSLGFTTIYSLKCQLSPPPNQRPQQLRGVETAKISEYVIHKLAGKFRMGSKFFVLYIICNYSRD